jgi:hypothetical protein
MYSFLNSSQIFNPLTGDQCLCEVARPKFVWIFILLTIYGG